MSIIKGVPPSEKSLEGRAQCYYRVKCKSIINVGYQISVYHSIMALDRRSDHEPYSYNAIMRSL